MISRISGSASVLETKKGRKAKALPRARGPLFTYRILSQEVLHSPAGKLPLLLDLGFSCFIQLTGAQAKNLKPGDIVQSQSKLPARVLKVPKADQSWLYHYKAYVERTVDGDTFWVRIDLGFRFWIRQKLRLSGLDAPELNTREGEETKRRVEEQLKKAPWVMITTTKPDKYDRYLSDIFIPRKGREVHLNQWLLDQGLAAAAPAGWGKGR